MVGIYKITNLINGKSYIGQSINIEQRWKAHRSRPFNPNSKQYNSSFYRAVRKYGLEHFSFEVLEECNEKELDSKEETYIALFHTTDPNYGYNLTTGGQKPTVVNSKVSSEKVEQIIDLLINTTLTEQEIANRFDVSQRFISGINLGEYKISSEYSYPIRKPGHRRKKYYCSECGKEIATNSQYCVQCSNKKRQKVERPDRESLKALIRTTPFIKIGEQFGVSDNAIRKWCKSYDLPYRKQEIKSISEENWAKI